MGYCKKLREWASRKTSAFRDIEAQEDAGGASGEAVDQTPPLALTDHSSDPDTLRGYNGSPLGRSHSALKPAYTTSCS
jgi:hypothetical protein